VAAARKVADANYALLEAEWTEVELAFYDYIAVASGHASIIKQALAARAEAQRKSWQSSLQAIRVTASQAIDDARAEGEAAIRRVAAETDKAEAKLGKASAVGGESWKIIKDGLEEARSVYDQAWKKISTAFLKDR
jgi:acyl-CoA hydrolase